MFTKILLILTLQLCMIAGSGIYTPGLNSDPYQDVGNGVGNNLIVGLNSNHVLEPEFEDDMKNITVPSGREAILSCVVSNLGKYKVGFLRKVDQTILTLDNRVITHNSRIGLNFDGFKTWNLIIRNVRPADNGCYICQLNTKIMKKRVACIDVLVSPNIIDEETSTDITVREGDNATLHCKASGNPKPKIFFRREDGEKILIRRGNRDIFKGYDNITTDTIHFVRLDRQQMGVYLCLATNQIPPAVSKRITLEVNFAPLVKATSQLFGAPFGVDVVVECQVEGSPRAFTYWMKNRGEMLLDGGLGLPNNSTKYSIEEIRMFYKVNMRLTIRNFEKKDVGIYNCMATNSLGKAEGSIRLHEIKMQKGTTIAASEKQVVTVPGYVTPSIVSTDGKNTGAHFPNKDSLWTTYAVAPRDSVGGSSPQDQNNSARRNDRPSSSSNSSSCATLTSSFTNHHLIMSIILLTFLITKLNSSHDLKR